jgi:hypothetical protein
VRCKSGGLCCRVAISGLLVGRFLGQPKRTQARGFLRLGLPCRNSGLCFGIHSLFFELFLGTLSVCLARPGSGTHGVSPPYRWTISPGGICFPEYRSSQPRAASSAENPLAVEHLTCRLDF